MTVRQKILRSSSLGARPAPGSRDPGELYINFPENQLGVIDTSGEAQDLIAVRYFSALANYVVNDVVVNQADGILYQCVSATGPSVFVPADWTTALDSFDNRLKGYAQTGLHEAYTGNLNSILTNSNYAITAAGVTNEPSDFVDIGFITTSMWTATSEAVQTLVGVTGASSGRSWRRVRNGSLWEAWSGIAIGQAPVGGIIMYNGLVADIPANWQICDGSNGTPDMTDRFAYGTNTEGEIGDTGGSADAVVVSHTHARGTMEITGTMQARDDVGRRSWHVGGGAFGQVGNATCAGYAGSGNNGPQSLDFKASRTWAGETAVPTGSVSGAGANLPPYVKLAYIQRLS